MLEDYSIMEKKPNGRPVQPPPKGGVTDSKKGLDSSNKPFGKYNKRRESGGYNNPKNDLLRKTSLPKAGKYPDKRPRPRNHSYNCGKADSKVADTDGPEIGSVFASGSKKQNLNHLLNFHLAPRSGAIGGNRGNVKPRNYTMNWFGTQKHKYNKEQFLQANCQFIVKENVDYTPHLVDPDLLVNWDAIEQIRVQSAGLSSCPICLDYPVAAKMTRCGHIYCWSCILHYLALSDKTWRKCPICYEAVHKHDLKSVVTLAYPPYNVGEEITLKLMMREKGSLLPIPVEQTDRKSVNGLLSLTEKEIDIIYSKLLLAKPEDVMSIIETEKAELMISLKDNEGCPESCFVEQALDLLKQREESLKNSVSESVAFGEQHTVTQKDTAPEKCSKELAACVELSSSDIATDKELSSSDIATDKELAEELNSVSLLMDSEESRIRYESISSEGWTGSEDDQQPFAYEDLDYSNQNTSRASYFYQASDGQHVYLQSLNIKMLELQYSKLDQAPLQLRGKIIEKESGSMTEELRKRLRYLKHLPVTCQFEVVEIDLSNYVSDEVFAHFEKELETRAKRRHRREREERKREKKITEEVNLIWGRHPAPKLRIDSHKQFPLCGTGSDEALDTIPSSPVLSRSQSVNSLSSVSTALDTAADNFPPASLSTSSVTDQSGPSFAQMLKSGNSQKSERGASKPLDYTELWPKPKSVGSENDLDEYVLVPHFRQSFSDAFAVALEKAEYDYEQGNDKKKKNKKKKQKVLFATGMVCSGK